MHKQLSNFAEMRLLEVDSGSNETPAVDMQGFDGVLFALRAESDDLDVHAKQGTGVDSSTGLINAGSGTIKGSQVEATATDDLVFIDIYRPTKRYVALDTQDNSHVSDKDVFALKYHSSNKPVDNDESGEVEGLKLVSPEEGTP